ncbi:hypothetical protein DSL72_002086 [Monilinia vaccinii-corymbosi]|uniref:Uncharacterized protein n=1 Tax=Monilinia vaccinii-corymbosi TaxID=61207 RepID=A0A8A3PBR6_9HELO|nr:hypothetical protein DSL72_002086 [Monilinia vaccinii-corymbosi]
MYMALQREADYFGSTNLANRLKEKKYLEAVKVSYSIEAVEAVEAFEASAEGITVLEGNLTNVKLDLWPKWSTKRVYVCPRDILGHRGNPSSCGKRCLGARLIFGVKWEEENILGGALLKQKTIIDDELCVDRSSGEERSSFSQED